MTDRDDGRYLIGALPPSVPEEGEPVRTPVTATQDMRAIPIRQLPLAAQPTIPTGTRTQPLASVSLLRAMNPVRKTTPSVQPQENADRKPPAEDLSRDSELQSVVPKPVPIAPPDLVARLPTRTPPIPLTAVKAPQEPVLMPAKAEPVSLTKPPVKPPEPRLSLRLSHQKVLYFMAVVFVVFAIITKLMGLWHMGLGERCEDERHVSAPEADSAKSEMTIPHAAPKLSAPVAPQPQQAGIAPAAVPINGKPAITPEASGETNGVKPIPPKYAGLPVPGFIFVGTVVADINTPDPLTFFGPSTDPKGWKLPKEVVRDTRERSAFKGGYSAISAHFCGTPTLDVDGWKQRKCRIGKILAFSSTSKKVKRFTPRLEYPIFVSRDAYIKDWDYILQKWDDSVGYIVPLGKVRNTGKKPLEFARLIPKHLLGASLHPVCNPKVQIYGPKTVIEPGDDANLCFMEEAEK